MFSLFRPAPFSDPVLGELVRSGGYWRGRLQLGSGSSLLALAGTRAAPQPAAVAAAREVSALLPGWRAAIETALFEHYEPYAEAVAAGDYPEASESLPDITSPSGVWPHAQLAFVRIAPLAGSLTTELGYTTAWDEEHTLGALFVGDRFVELCGSVLPP